MRERLSLFEQVRDSAPDEYEKIEPLMIMTGQMALAVLGFGTTFTGELDSLTNSAVGAYQRSRGLPVNRSLFDPLTYDLLDQDSETILRGLTGVHPGFKVFVSNLWDRGWFSAKGGWRATNSELRAKVQAAYLDCDRSTAECSMHLAQINDRQLELDFPEVYKITSWDKAEIRAMKDYPCARYDLVISRTQETVEGTRTTLSQGKGCEHMDATSIQLELYNGLPEASRMWERLNLSPRVRRALEPDTQKQTAKVERSD